MIRRSVFAVPALVALTLFVCASCAALFDGPSQCKLDSDCARFGEAVCDLGQGVCVRPSLDAGEPAKPDVRVQDGSPEASTRCGAAQKPLVAIDTTPLTTDAGSGEITTSVTLDCTKDWLLRGRVFVRSGATLSIEAGTTIRAAVGSGASLVINPGGKLVATGQRDAPVVFTGAGAAPTPGDWRGVFVLGRAPATATLPLYNDPALAWGGTNAQDTSGELSFVRIEYGSFGLVLAGVGNQTKIDSVMVRKTAATENCYLFLGGTVDAKHLVCQSPSDDEFEFNLGYAGRLQYLFGHKTPIVGAGRNGLLTDDSSPVIYNATICGEAAPNLGYGLVLRNGTRLDMRNAIFTGWFGGLDTVGPVLPLGLNLASSIMFGNATNPAYVEDVAVVIPTDPKFNDDVGFDELAWFNASVTNKTTDPGIVDCYDAKSPKPWPATTLTAGAATPPNDGFFDTTGSFIGAFRDSSDPWMKGAWVRFDDQ